MSEDARRYVAAAGWFEGRVVSDSVIEQWARRLRGYSPEFNLVHAAFDALREFGGLHVRSVGPGVECARTSFHLDPTRCFGENDRFDAFDIARRHRLFPLGVVDDGRAFLVIADDGGVYVMESACWEAGDTIIEAINRFVEGRRLRRIE